MAYSNVFVKHNGHTIKVIGIWKERVLYDDKLVSEKINPYGAYTHSFTIKEGDKKINYTIETHFSVFQLKWSRTIRRNGELIYSSK